MRCSTRSLLLCGAAAVASSSLFSGASAACTTFSLIALPTDLGIDKCIGNNANAFVSALLAPSTKCSLTQVLALTNSQSIKNVTALLTEIVAAPEKLSSILYNAMKTSTSAQIDSFCTDWATNIAPCAEVLVPILTAKTNADLECCGQLGDVLDLLNLVVPPTVSKESFLLTDVVNGLNNLVCAKRADTKQTCGASIFSQLTTKYTADTFRVFESFLLPFVSAASGSECDAFQGLPYVSSLTKQTAAQTAIDLSCCVDYARPLLQSVQSGFEFVVSNSPLEFLNGIVEFSSATSPSGLQFVDALQNAKTRGCSYKTTCSAPSGLTTYATRTITPGTNDPKKNQVSSDTSCTKTTKCDAQGTTCSEVCAKGSVTLPAWVSQSLAYQRKLAYSGPMCYAQLPATHNSAITLADGFGNRDQLMNKNLNSASKPYSYMKTNNHVLSLTDQLNVGVRWLEVDVHYFLKDLRTAHCGNLGSNSIQVLASTLNAELAKYGTVNWSADLLGCFPSLSGIKADEQPTTRASLQEIRKWLDASLNQNQNQDELVFVYLDTGSELTTLGKLPTLNALLTEVFGELLVPIAELEALQKAGWTASAASASASSSSGSNAATLQKFIDAGRRVVVLANENTGLAYKLGDFCKGHQILSTDYINALPDATTRVLGGKKIYSGDYFLRSYQSALRYISLSESGTISQTLPTLFTSSNIYNYVRWNVNLVATDALDSSLVKPQIWSWAENEPSTPLSNGTAIVTSQSGRWRTLASASNGTLKACWTSAQLAWSIVNVDAACPSNSIHALPADPYQNYLLQQALVTQGITRDVFISVGSSASPTPTSAPPSTSSAPTSNSSTPATSAPTTTPSPTTEAPIPTSVVCPDGSA